LTTPGIAIEPIWDVVTIITTESGINPPRCCGLIICWRCCDHDVALPFIYLVFPTYVDSATIVVYYLPRYYLLRLFVCSRCWPNLRWICSQWLLLLLLLSQLRFVVPSVIVDRYRWLLGGDGRRLLDCWYCWLLRWYCEYPATPYLWKKYVIQPNALIHEVCI